MREEREVLAATVRRAVLRSGDAEAIWALGTGEPEDIELIEALIALLSRLMPAATLSRSGVSPA